MIYFDNAATSGKKPITVINAVNNALNNLSANPGRSGHTLSQNTAIAIYSARDKVAKFFGATGPEKVAFTANCTHSINIILKGVLDVKDHIIVSDMEHNAVMRPLHKLGASYSMARVSLFDDDETVENFAKLIKPNTKMIFCTGASNVTGKILPIEKIGGMCREKGIFFGVDAAQIAGVIPIDMQKMCIDFLAVAPHKGLYAPMGVGILIAENAIGNTLIEGGTGTDSANLEQPSVMPEQLESGTVNLPAISGVSAGLDFVKKSRRKIFEHEIALTNYLYENLLNMPNAILYTPSPSMYNYAPVLSFNISGYSSDETADILNRKGIAVRSGLHCAPTAHQKLQTLNIGTVRFSPSFYNITTDVNYLINILKNINKKY